MTLDLPKSGEEWMRWIERRLSAQEVRRTGSRTNLVAFEKGVRSTSFTALASTTANITFTAGRFTTAPNVHANINSTAGVAAGWNARATNVTASGFTLLLFGPSATWAGIPVQWTAFE